MQEERIIRRTISSDTKPTEAQIREIEEAKQLPIIYDEDSPPLTEEQYAEMAMIARQRRKTR